MNRPFVLVLHLCCIRVAFNSTRFWMWIWKQLNFHKPGDSYETATRALQPATCNLQPACILRPVSLFSLYVSVWQVSEFMLHTRYAKHATASAHKNVGPVAVAIAIAVPQGWHNILPQPRGNIAHPGIVLAQSWHSPGRLWSHKTFNFHNPSEPKNIIYWGGLLPAYLRPSVCMGMGVLCILSHSSSCIIPNSSALLAIWFAISLALLSGTVREGWSVFGSGLRIKDFLRCFLDNYS